MSQLISLEFWESVLGGGLRLGLPVGVAAAGELIGERSGTLNLGLEGTMSIGALGGVVGAVSLGAVGGLLLGALAGAVVGLLFAALVLQRRANEVVVGFAVSLGGVGLATFLYRTMYARPPRIVPFKAVDLPGLRSIPLIGPVLFRQPLVVWLLPLTLAAVAWVLHRTRLGLELRAAGDAPQAALARGVAVNRVRTAAVIAAGALGGLGGALLSAGIVGEFSDQLVGGRGFVALVLVIAARWRPSLLLPAAWGIGALQAFQLKVQTSGGIGLPVELLRALPYLVTLIVLAVGVGSANAPRALGRLTE
ncbi:MAG: ABC transporter permease [Ilumatobacteraceae bacterium]